MMTRLRKHRSQKWALHRTKDFLKCVDMSKRKKLELVKVVEEILENENDTQEDDEDIVFLNGKRYRKCSYDSWREAFSKEQSRQEIERYKKPLVGTSWHGSDE